MKHKKLVTARVKVTDFDGDSSCEQQLVVELSGGEIILLVMDTLNSVTFVFKNGYVSLVKMTFNEGGYAPIFSLLALTRRLLPRAVHMLCTDESGEVTGAQRKLIKDAQKLFMKTYQ